MEIGDVTSDDAEDAARLYLQSAEHHTRLDPDFYRLPDLDGVFAHYQELTARGKTEPLMCFVAESDETLVRMVVVRISERLRPTACFAKPHRFR